MDRRRFTIAVLIGGAVMVIPYLLVLWDNWNGKLNPLRGVPYDNFYDLQARAMFHGHLNLAKGSMGIEAFVHDGRYYTYFGIFPSLIRMPILLVTNSFDGQLTAPSLLLSWVVTGLLSALLLWRLRIVMRGGDARLSRGEAVSYGALMATILGGSVIFFLAAIPYIYNEDFAWSVPLFLGSLFALLGMLEKPSWRRVIWCAVFVFFTNLNRTPAGYAAVIGAGLVALWFLFGRGGRENRRWAWPMIAVGAVSFLVSCAITYAKFGIPVGLPMADQVWASVNAHRRYFLAANGGKAFSFAFLPSTLWVYFQPFGIHVSGLFPFVTPPRAPAAWLDGVVLDQTYPTGSVPATMPLLFLLGLWGLITAFWPKSLARLTRIVIITAGLGTTGVLLWGYIAERYMADLMPVIIVAAGVGIVDVWRRLEGRSHRVRVTGLGVILVVAAYCIFANVAISVTPQSDWNKTQLVNFVSTQQSLSLSSLSASVVHGSKLPYWAPAGTLFDADHCAGLYLSSGNNMADVPGQQIEHFTWMPVNQSPAFTRKIRLTFNRPATDLTQPVTILTYGASSLVVEPAGTGYIQLALKNSGTSDGWPGTTGWRVPITNDSAGKSYSFIITIDPYLQRILVLWNGSNMIQHYIATPGTIDVKVTPPATDGSVPVVSVANPQIPDPPNTDVCRSLAHSS
jgi:hypothetical protein